jgi:uncharacterized protein (TIGR01777 family)
MMTSPHRIVIPGGTGFIGRKAARHFAALGWDVVVLSRNPEELPISGVRTLPWDGRTLGTWAVEIDGAAAILNLAGRSVNCRYHARNKREIYASRLESTRIIGEAIAAAQAPPPVWLNSASATIYRHAEDRPMDELTGELGKGFSVDVCKKWEAALEAAPAPRTRKVALRSAMVFGTGSDGVYGAFRRLARIGLGGTLGPGTQFVSWIHETDFLNAVVWLIDHSTLSGVVNLASPNPMPNREFMALLRREARGLPFGLHADPLMLEIGAFFLRTETELLLKSRRAIPTRLLEDGFTFRYPTLPEACREIEGRWDG